MTLLASHSDIRITSLIDKKLANHKVWGRAEKLEIITQAGATAASRRQQSQLRCYL